MNHPWQDGSGQQGGRPSQRQLRQFGLAAMVLLPALAWLWSGHGTATLLGASAEGVAVAAVGFVYPKGLRLPYLALSILAMPMGFIVHEVVLALLYFGVFVPLGLAFRLAGRDPLQRRFDATATSYWQPKRQPADAASYFRRW